jgi:glycosyltransferase involved in cell wall biosynthesis
MTPSISVCIPTYQRPKFLKEAIDSVLAQTLQPIEIVIGDDSRDDLTQKLVANIQKDCPIPIVYTRHSPSLGQAENINFIYKIAKADKIVLLHDDDLLMPNAIEDLHSCWDLHPDLVAAYGKQYIISEDGIVDSSHSDELNRMFFRTSNQAGLQKSSLEAAIIHQFPNDCFMVLASAAKDIKWRSYEEVGNGGEFDFSLRLSIEHPNFFFLDKHTAKYRLSSISMSKSFNDDAAAQSFYMVLNTSVSSEIGWAKKHELRRAAPIAIVQLINLGKRKQAAKIYFSNYHPWAKRLSLGGMRRLLKLLLPRVIGKLF